MKTDYINIIKSKDAVLIKKHITIIKHSIRDLKRELKENEELIALELSDKKYLEAELAKLESGKI